MATTTPELEDQIRLVLMSASGPMTAAEIASEVGETSEVSTCRCRCGNRHENLTTRRPRPDDVRGLLRRLHRHRLVVQGGPGGDPDGDAWEWAGERLPDAIPSSWTDKA